MRATGHIFFYGFLKVERVIFIESINTFFS